MATIMKKLLSITIMMLMVTAVTFAQKNPRKQANGKIGNVSVEVDYGAPSVRDRTIWGELVPYDKVWRAGANENTTISFDSDVTVGKNAVPAGKYGLFIIPAKEGPWTVILSKKNDAWGSNGYDKSNDLIRIKAKHNKADKSAEQLKFTVFKKGVQFAWENAKVWIPVK